MPIDISKPFPSILIGSESIDNHQDGKSFEEVFKERLEASQHEKEGETTSKNYSDKEVLDFAKLVAIDSENKERNYTMIFRFFDLEWANRSDLKLKVKKILGLHE